MYAVKFKKLNPNAIIPSYVHDGDAGLDLFSIEAKKIEPHEFCLIRTGLSLELPKNTEAQVRPRSGLAARYGITVLNTPGTIDESYRGELCVILINHGKEVFMVELGMKIAQLVIQPTYRVELIETTELSDTERGNNGFGSSGNR